MSEKLGQYGVRVTSEFRANGVKWISGAHIPKEVILKWSEGEQKVLYREGKVAFLKEPFAPEDYKKKRSKKDTLGQFGARVKHPFKADKKYLTGAFISAEVVMSWGYGNRKALESQGKIEFLPALIEEKETGRKRTRENKSK